MKFVFCLYDLNYTDDFLRSWVNLCHLLNSKKIIYNISPGDSCNAFYAKQIALKGNVLSGKNQKPFQGQYKYEYLVFLSGNIIFNNNDFVHLYNTMSDNEFNFLSAKVKNRYKLTDKTQDRFELAEYVDFDMTMVRYGVFEKLTYPWFTPFESRTKEEQNFVDISICKRIQKEAGVNLLIDPKLQIKRRVVSYE